MKYIGKRLRKLRINAKYTQKYLANTLGVSRNHINRIEAGQYNPSKKLIKLICEKFDVNEDWLLTGEGDSYRPPGLKEIRERAAKSPKMIADAIGISENEYLNFEKSPQSDTKYMIDIIAYYLRKSPESLYPQFSNYDKRAFNEAIQLALIMKGLQVVEDGLQEAGFLLDEDTKLSVALTLLQKGIKKVPEQNEADQVEPKE